LADLDEVVDAPDGGMMGAGPYQLFKSERVQLESRRRMA
jgi:hypothetical protein